MFFYGRHIEHILEASLVRFGLIIVAQVLTADYAPATGAAPEQIFRWPVAERSVAAAEIDQDISPENVITEMKEFINLNDYVGFNNYLASNVGELIFTGKISPKPIANFLIDVWEKQRELYPDLKWPNATSDRFRVLVAVELFLAERYWGVDYDTREVHNYVRERVMDSDVFVASFALNAISIKNDPSDLDLLVKIVSSPEPVAFKSGVRAVGSLCTAEAKNALLELAERAKDAERKAYFLKTLDDFYGAGDLCPR